ncbi:serine hydrolase domain-containing protein [Rubrivirga sp.]|uniref:serine hydrolase domain-containing protein n=1 Tax=Rubrivirga sp. TaxID=1885344 RepID=UPI003C71BCFB
MVRTLLVISALFAMPFAMPPAAQTLPLALGTDASGTVGPSSVPTYSIDLEAGTFVAGAVQQGADVVVTVTGPDRATVVETDGTAHGLDPFSFSAEHAGTYTITVAPYQDADGPFCIGLTRVEPVAEDAAGRVRQLFADYDHDGEPGALVAVVRDGEVLLSDAFGGANLTHGVPMTLDTRTNIGSTSKQFTALALVMLEERGRLSLEDDVREYVPELPDFGETVTLRHLLTHTSGYREVYNLLIVGGRRVLEGDAVDRREHVEAVQRQPALQNAPGAEWNYNNTGYGLAALVLERVTGRAFPDWMAENVFAPLGMDDTVVRAAPGALVVNSAQGYVVADDGWRERQDLGASMGAGGVYSTVGDLARWMAHYAEPTLVSAESVRQMTTPYVLSTGEATSYGLGLFVRDDGGRRHVHHGGSDTAHRSAFSFFPDLGAGVIVLANAPTDVDGLARRSLRAVAPDVFGDPPVESAETDEPGLDAADFDDALFDDYAGRYALDAAPAFVLEFRRGDDGGYLAQATGQPALEILPTSDSTFVLAAVEAGVTFHRDADGAVRSATFHRNGDNRASKLDAEPMADAVPIVLEDYTGRYVSDEIETFYALAVEDGVLMARTRRNPKPLVLQPSGPDTFASDLGPTLSFERDATGAITGFTLDADRSRDIAFRLLG